ncbi:spermiogenesis-related protein stanley-cup [Haematobia irritans]|uniref:spermiogenesis-related protein stanley-cup n=1 Tax=Haematobia irritans TaxID=7368 RepID=UPI003F5029C8
MSLKGYAMLAAIYHNHRSSTSSNSGNSNHNDNITSVIPTTTATTSTSATSQQSTSKTVYKEPTISTTISSSEALGGNGKSLKPLVISNKSTSRQQSKDLQTTKTSTASPSLPTASTTRPHSNSTIWPNRPANATTSPLPVEDASTTNTSPPAVITPQNPYSNHPTSDHFEIPSNIGLALAPDTNPHQSPHLHHRPHRHHHLQLHPQQQHTSNSGNIYSDSDENDESETTEEEEEELEQEDNAIASSADSRDEHNGRQRPMNTFYGSGFGIFHQQRSNMGGAGGNGGIALITGSSSSGLSNGSFSNSINTNVNLLLGGAMLTLITTILCVVCYCCHRNIKKRTEAAYRQQRQWLENDPNMEIYSVEQCYETSGLFVGDSMDGLATIPALHHEPPPSYDAVVAMQEQQQLLLQQQQQLLMQQLQNNSPPPGYRSSLDVSCILAARAAALTPPVLSMGSSDANSLATSTLNVRSTSNLGRTPPDGSTDCNGNRSDVNAIMPTTSAAGSSIQHPSNFLRVTTNKQQQQRQRNLPGTTLANFNMKKVLQAQSCCSLQRAEVENMWNAAAAALAARSNHMANDPRSSAGSTSSPTLVMQNRKLSNAQGNSSKSQTPETFGSRYLKQQNNYYRRGCPLCGKFRYDNESMLSISMESDLDTMATGGNTPGDNANHGNHNDDVSNNGMSRDENLNCLSSSTAGDEDGEDDECSCLHTNRRRANRQSLRNSEAIAVAIVNPYQNENNSNDSIHHQNMANSNAVEENIELLAAPDLNANVSDGSQMEISTLTNNNGSSGEVEEPSCSHGNSQIETSPAVTETDTEAATRPTNTNQTTTTPTSTSSGAAPIDLDCINDNGIISLDMSKIIDKTGLPTYDAALKLESSGYV